MDHIAQKAYGTRKQMVMLWDEMTLGKLVRELFRREDVGKSELLHHTIAEDKENKYLHWFIISFAHFVHLCLKTLFFPFFALGKKIEKLLNHNIPGNEESPGYISFLGHLDTRKELDKDIMQGDGRYLAALSMMASKLAYENENFIGNVVSQHWKMKFEAFYDLYNEFQNTLATQAFIFRDNTAQTEKVIVAFRGTSPFDGEDWSTDIDLSWCQLDKMPGKLHRGFLTALGLKKVHPQASKDNREYYYDGYFPKDIDHKDPKHPLAYYTIRDKLKEILMAEENKKAKFTVTGHSLGGALAILFPAILALHEEKELLERLDAVYTFGQPRVGNQKFVDFMDKKLREYRVKYFRIVYGCDIVPTVPWDNASMRFKHFGTCIQFNSLYQGKIVDREPPLKEMHEKASYLSKGLSWLTKYTLKVANAVLELIRGFIIENTAGQEYREGWLLILCRIMGIIAPCVIAHNPQDYVNATRLASPDLFLSSLEY